MVGLSLRRSWQKNLPVIRAPSHFGKPGRPEVPESPAILEVVVACSGQPKVEAVSGGTCSAYLPPALLVSPAWGTGAASCAGGGGGP